MAFDRGAFLEAAWAWETAWALCRHCCAKQPAAQHERARLDRPAMLAKAALAYHLAGAKPQAARLRTGLKTSHTDARAVIAGRQAKLASFLDRSLAARPALSLTPAEPVRRRGWPSCPTATCR